MNTRRGPPAVLAAAGAVLLAAGANHAVLAGEPVPAQAPPASAALLGGALPGGAVISAMTMTLTPVAGGAAVSVPIAGDGSFKLANLSPGRYRLAVASTPATAVPKQTQGATFGEKVNAGLHSTGSAVAQGAAASKHDTAKNSVGNIRAREVPPTAPVAAGSPSADPSARMDIQGGMPNRISMNVTIGKRLHEVDVDGPGTEVDVGPEGSLAGRVSAK